MELLRKEYLKDLNSLDILVDTNIPITLSKDGDNFIIAIDGVDWVTVTNETHAIVLFTMMMENMTDYMNYSELN